MEEDNRTKNYSKSKEIALHIIVYFEILKGGKKEEEKVRYGKNRKWVQITWLCANYYCQHPWE